MDARNPLRVTLEWPLEQLTGLGLSQQQVRRRVERGVLHRVHRDVFAVGHTNVVAHARLVAALLTCGPGAFLSHRTAAAVWGLRQVSATQIEVTTVSAFTPARRGLRMHRTTRRPAAEDLTVRSGLRVGSVVRLLIELAPRERRSGSTGSSPRRCASASWTSRRRWSSA